MSGTKYRFCVPWAGHLQFIYISNLLFLHNMFFGTRVALFIGYGLRVSEKTVPAR